MTLRLPRRCDDFDGRRRDLPHSRPRSVRPRQEPMPGTRRIGSSGPAIRVQKDREKAIRERRREVHGPRIRAENQLGRRRESGEGAEIGFPPEGQTSGDLPRELPVELSFGPHSRQDETQVRALPGEMSGDLGEVGDGPATTPPTGPAVVAAAYVAPNPEMDEYESSALDTAGPQQTGGPGPIVIP